MLSILHFLEPTSMFYFSGNNIPYLGKDPIPRKGAWKKPTMKDFKSLHSCGWKLRILAWRILVRGFRFKREKNLTKEAEEGLFANLSLYPYGDPSSDGEWFYKEVYPNLTEGCQLFLSGPRTFSCYLAV